MKPSLPHSALASAMILTLASTSTFAQSAANTANTLDAIHVTASRAMRSYGFLAPTPTTLVDGKDLRDANISVVADQLNKLPALHTTWIAIRPSPRIRLFLAVHRWAITMSLAAAIRLDFGLTTE